MFVKFRPPVDGVSEESSAAEGPEVDIACMLVSSAGKVWDFLAAFFANLGGLFAIAQGRVAGSLRSQFQY